MSTMMDFSYRFFGTVDELATARDAIGKLQAQYVGCNGDGDHDFSMEPELDDNGAMNWSGYTLDDTEDFEEQITAMTAGTNLSCFAYWGTTDGCSESALNLLVCGEGRGLGQWNAEIGICSAVAIAVLEKSAIAKELLVLIETFLIAEQDGWDEEDYPWLLRAEVLACAIATALELHPGLLSSKGVGKALARMKKPLKSVRGDLKDVAGFKASELAQIDQFQSIIESLELDGAVPKSKQSTLSKRPAMSL